MSDSQQSQGQTHPMPASDSKQTSDISGLAEAVRASFVGQSFGIIKFWGFGVIPPNDQSYVLTGVTVEGEALELVFMHESGSGTPGVIRVLEPSGLEPVPAGMGTGMAIRAAQQLRLDDHEAIREGAQFRLSTPRGQGLWPLDGKPALVLAR